MLPLDTGTFKHDEYYASITQYVLGQYLNTIITMINHLTEMIATLCWGNVE